MKSSTYIYLVILSVLSVSCLKWGSRENNRLIEQAIELVDVYPDSALMLLDAVNTVRFSNAEKMEYNLLRIQARNNVGMDISNEVEIFDVKDFFTNRKDPEKAALACYYAALVAAGNNNIENAMEYYQEALEYVQKTELKLLQGKILYNMGSLNYNNLWYENALFKYKQALKIFQSLDMYQREIHSLNSIAYLRILMKMRLKTEQTKLK